MPYWRLSGFYLVYFATLGALLPYWGLYLKSIGFDATAIGSLFAIMAATKIVAPNVWGWIADHIGHRMLIIRMASLCTVVAFAGVFLFQDFWWLALIMSVFSFFWNASLPQFEATTMSHLGDSIHRYSSIRLWGSIGFILSVALLGPVLEQYGTGILPAVLLVLFAAIWFASLTVPESAAGHLTFDHEPLRNILRRPVVVALLVVCFLMQASHGPYYTFFSIYLEEHHYSRTAIGQLWALGVIAEIGVFLFMYRLLPRFGVRTLLLASLALTSLRWLLVAWFVEDVPIMIMAQILHAASFGVYHAVAISLIHRFFTGKHQGKGQALYSSLSFGAGGAIGSLYSGYTWISVGPAVTYSMAALLSAIAFMVAWFAFKAVDEK